MKTPTQIVYEIAGSPELEGCVDTIGRCFVCRGEMTSGMPVQDWIGSNYTDQNRAMWPSATHVCVACVLVHSWTAPPGHAIKEGKKRPPNWRMFSHLWEDGHGYQTANKGDKPAIRRFIEREHKAPWFAAIADTGQKHVLPFTPVNGPGRSGIVLMDELRVTVPSDVGLIERMTGLLTDGTTKAGIETGRHHSGAFERLGSCLLEFERDDGRFRGSGWFTLSLWLAQRDENEVQRRMAAEKETKQHARRRKARKAQDSDDGSDSPDPKRVPQKRVRQRPEALGTTRDEAPGGSVDQRDTGGAVDQVCAQPSARGSRQGVLPGLG